MNKIRFSKEPIAWLGVIILILQLINNIVSGQPIDSTSIDAVITAIGTILGRRFVTPVIGKGDNA
jgi:hypothetical protein